MSAWYLIPIDIDFERLYTNLQNQDDSEPGKIDNHSSIGFPRLKNWLSSLSDTLMSFGFHEQATYSEDSLELLRALEAYLQVVLSFSVLQPNNYVLIFIGLIKDKSISSLETEVECKDINPKMHYSKLDNEVNTGDIILFQCTNAYSAMQRRFTGSEWDHCGVAVRLTLSSYVRLVDLQRESKFNGKEFNINLHINTERKNSILCLVECTVEGVTCLPLINRLRAYSYHKVSDLITIRRLNILSHESRVNKGYGLNPLTADNIRNLAIFLNSAIGKKYEFKASSIALNAIRDPNNAKDLGNVWAKNLYSGVVGLFDTIADVSNAKDISYEVSDFLESSNDFTQPKSSYYCSELVAAALKCGQALGVLAEGSSDIDYWPGSFGSGNLIDKSLNILSMFYSEEIVICFNEYEFKRRESPLQSNSFETVQDDDMPRMEEKDQDTLDDIKEIMSFQDEETEY